MSPSIANAPASIPFWQLWRNPIFLRYCRSRLRPQGLGIALLLTLLMAGFIFFVTRNSAIYRGHLSLVDAERAPIIPLLVWQAIILFVLGTGQMAGGFTAEADEGGIDYQRLTPLSPMTKVLGYLFGLPVREYVMFLATLPFSIWAMWRGQVAVEAWLPLLGVFISSTWLYHLTGLVAGTVVSNRRWAFLISIGIVFALYTVLPQAAKFGLVFFKYLTLWPVLDEVTFQLLPQKAGDIVKLAQTLTPEVKFFGLNFSEWVFTFFTQGVIVITFIAMLWRRWRSPDAHILGKVWAVILFAWMHLVLLGNALPIVEDGSIFPSRSLRRRFLRDFGSNWRPEPFEAVSMGAIYGVVTLLLMVILIMIITPVPETQLRGLRRAKKLGLPRIPIFSDAAGARLFVLFMAGIGAVGWYFFMKGLADSHWYPGRDLPPWIGGTFFLLLVTAAISFHALFEGWGAFRAFLAMILVGFVPAMIGTILGVIGKEWHVPAVWIAGVSPLSTPIYSVASLTNFTQIPPHIEKAVPMAFWFWHGIGLIVCGWLIHACQKAKATRLASVGLEKSPSETPPLSASQE